MIYDYIIIGTGASGLNLIDQILKAGLKDKKILVLEKSSLKKDDKTWSFWDKEDNEISKVVFKSWPQVRFSNGHSFVKENSQLVYQTVRSDDFYNHILNEIKEKKNFDVKYENVKNWSEEKDHVNIFTGDNLYKAKYLFSSVAPKKYPFSLIQHFKGWEIKTEEEVFNDQEITLMDFKEYGIEGSHFFYILPYSKNHALIEFTVISEKLLDEKEYDREIKKYISANYKNINYDIVRTEKGAIPMDLNLNTNRDSDRIIYLGTVGGQTKPTTGYTFKRSQRHAFHIVKNILKYDKPFYKVQENRRFIFYDRLLLHIIKNRTYDISLIFEALFKRNPMQRVWRFLDEKSTIIDEILIFSRLPWKPFLQALFKNYVRF